MKVWKALILIIFELTITVVGNLQMEILKKMKEENSTVLSRKRRYLVFPEGSSFQVVFDLTYPSVGMGNAFVFGNTAAMAYELPTTPIFLDKKKISKEMDENSENSTVEKHPQHMEHSDENEHKEWHPWQPPLIWEDLHTDYREPTQWQSNNGFNFNNLNTHDSSWNEGFPARFYSNSFEDFLDRSYLQKNSPIIPKQPIYYGGNSNRNQANFWTKRSFRNERNIVSLKPTKTTAKVSSSLFRKSVSHHVHRRSRRDLFVRIEKLFSALSKDGKKCILKAICQVNKIANKKGTMWEEIIKTIFKVKPHAQYPNEDHYDKAANLNHDCEKMYPECDGHVLSNIFRRKIKK